MYDFKTLSPIDFEDLVRDLLQEEMKITLESFTTGTDGGIDFRYSKKFGNEIVVQCKQFSGSTYKDFFRNLKDEVEKVKKINPKKYIVATAVGLTPNRKEKIKKMFHPFIKRTADIYGRNDVNNLLGKFPKIEKRHFKLWLSSLEVFEQLLHGKIVNFTRDSLDNIRSRIRNYVQGESFSEALKNLEQHNLCIIAGIPGIGKTTLAEMLLVHFVNSGYEAVKITEDISEASSMDHSIEKRIFYYDDFLGQTSSAEKLKKNEDQRLLEFFETIRKSKHSKFILTTREHILNNAKISYEKFDRHQFDMDIYVIDLSKYTRMIRSKILFNHVYFSDLPWVYKKNFLYANRYLKIIDHKNYSPRIVDLLTKFSKVKHVEPDKYFEYFISNLENPLTVWGHAFSEQITDASRNLLLVMASMPGDVFLEDVSEAFLIFNKRQAQEYGYATKPSDFKKSLKELDGNFLSFEIISGRTIIRFQNPSVRDFIQKYLNTNQKELMDIFGGAFFVDQLMWIFAFLDNAPEEEGFIKALLNSKDMLVEKMKQIDSYKSCRLIGYSGIDGNIKRGYYSISFEDKTGFIAFVFTKFKIDEIKVLLNEMIWKVRERFSQNKVDKSDLITLLKKLKELDVLEVSLFDVLIKEAKSYLAVGIDEINGFYVVCEFYELFPSVFDEDEKKKIKKEFVEIAHDSIDGTIASDVPPDEVRSEAFKIRRIAGGFGINLERQLDRLEDYATKLENDLDAKTNPDDESWKDFNVECKDEEIISLFGQLKE